MKNFTLYTNPQSRGINILWMLEECEANYDTIVILYGEQMKSESFTAINPMGKVPVLRHGETIITETAAIVTYIAEQFPEKNLIPQAGSVERGQYYRWLCFAIHAEYAMMDKYLGVGETPDRRKAIGYGCLDDIIQTLHHALENKTYIIGEQFSALDVYISGLLFFATHMAQVIDVDDVIFSQYLAHHTVRPAHGKTMMLTENMEKELSQ